MCTLTIIRPDAHPERLRAVFSRDEQRSRAPGLPPSCVRVGGRRLLCPIDPESGGTWIGITDAGLLLCVLNANPRAAPRPPANPLSRGMIIPTIAMASDIHEACGFAEALPIDRLAPFRLVVCDGQLLMDSRRAANQCRFEPTPMDDTPLLATSSGLGDHVVEPARSKLFAEMLLTPNSDGGPSLSRRQDAFHSHRWADREQLSVLMRRQHARTVSRTVVELGPMHARMTTTNIDDHGGLAEFGRHSAELAIGLARPRGVPA